MEPKIKTPTQFAEEIEELIWKHDISYMDAVLLYCKDNGLEIETAATFIKMNSKVKERVQLEAEKLNFLPKVARLPLDDDPV